MKKIQITLTVEESKELIARSILFHPSYKHSQKKGSVLLKGGTTVSRISENLLGFPLRICGRITERGTVSLCKSSSAPHSVLINNNSWENIDDDIIAKTASLGTDDLIICSANAFDNNGRAALMAGSVGGGNIGKSLSSWYTEGVKILIPVGIEKMIPGDLNETISKTSRKGIDFSNGMSVGLMPIIGEIFTEVEAFKLLGNVDVYVIGAGGLYEAKGSSVFQIEGKVEDIDKIISFVKGIKNSIIDVSGETLSLMECTFPSERCRNHLGCSYKAGKLKDSKSKKLGIITIGQSPRVDFTKDIIPLLSKEYQIIEKGALDNFTFEEVEERFSPVANDEILITRMRDGKQVKIAEKFIVPLIQEAVWELEKKNCRVILLMCTGKFPEIKHSSILVKPQEIIPDVIKKLIQNKKLGLIIPDESQKNQIYKWWNDIVSNLVVTSASPYKSNEELIKAAKFMNDEKVDLIFMDCMGYSKEMKDLVQEITNKIVILPRTFAVRIINEL